MATFDQGPFPAGAVRCAECGEPIGVYEPLVHVINGIAHRTSRAADPHIACSEVGLCYHLACHQGSTTEPLALE
jgi:hypothetical protein